MHEGLRLHRVLRSPPCGPLPPRTAGEAALTEKLQDGQGGGRQSYWAPSGIPARSSFCRSSTMARRQRRGRHLGRLASLSGQNRAAPSGRAAALPLDQHTLMVRRRIAAGVGVVLLIVIVLVINSCVKGQKTQALKDYNHEVSTARPGIRRTRVASAVLRADRRRRQVGAERRGAGRPAARAGPGSRVARQEAERPWLDVRRTERPAAAPSTCAPKPSPRSLRSCRRRSAARASRRSRRSPATWRSSSHPTSSTPSASCR